MTDEQAKQIEEFIRYEQARGIRKIQGIEGELKTLFRYLEACGIDYKALGTKGAQEFQTHLATMEDPDGSPHYATLTVKTIVGVASRFYNYLKHAGLVASNPFLKIKRIRTERKLPRNIPQEAKLMELLEKFRRFWDREFLRDQRIYYKIHAIAELQYATGMRIREVLNLKESDIDFRGRTIRVADAKKGRERTAYLNEYATGVLELYARQMREAVNVNKDGDALFGLRDESAIVSTLNKYLTLEGKRLGIGRFTSHNFRHCLGFHLLRRGCDMRYIQLILGHEDMNTTTIYTKVEKGDLKEELDRYHPRGKARS
jgi:integrase/recombinase XerD